MALENFSTQEIDRTNKTTNESGAQTELETWSMDFRFWCLSVIIPVGLMFNGISVFVFMSKSLRRRSASWYLAALAISDSITLLTCCFEYWLKDRRIGLPIIRMSEYFCIIISQLSYATRLFSAILVTSFTVERFICVVAPLRRAALSKPGRARKLIGIQCLICVICTSFIPFTLNVIEGSHGRDPECDVRSDRYQTYFICITIFLLFGSIFIPIIVICTLNLFIMKKVCTRQTSLRQQTSIPVHSRLAKTVQRKSFNTATILMTVSTSFVVLNIPYCISFLMLFFRHFKLMTDWGPEALGNLFAVKYITTVPYYLNYCINFLLYNVCARAFRIEMGRTLCYMCRVYESRRESKKRSMSSRPTQSLRLTITSYQGIRGDDCNHLFMVPKCGGRCTHPETSSFISDPAYPGHYYPTVKK